jgi:imidazolonepropionase-like amidohydrolase
MSRMTIGDLRFTSLLIHAAVLGAGFASLAAESVLFTGATVHTVSGATLSPGNVLVRDGKIVSVSKDAARADRTVDLQGLHLYPGLILPATTLGLVEINAVRATRDYREVGSYTPDVASWIAVNPDSELLPVARANGITHFLPVPTGGTVSGTSGLMQMRGWTVEEMAIQRPVALHLDWPSMGLDTRPREELPDRSRAKSIEQQIKDRQSRVQAVDEFFNEAEAYAKGRPAAGRRDVRGDLVPAWEAMLPFLDGRIPVFIRANDVREIRAAVEWSARRRYKAVITGGRDAWLAADLLAKHKVPVIFEHVFSQPARDTDPYDVHFKAAKVLHEAGVTFAFGEGLDSSGAYNARNLPYSAAQAAAFGLPRDTALRALTLAPAQILGVGDRLGSLEKGKDATFIAVDGDILDIRANVKRMWIGGQEADLSSRHTRLYEKYKGRPKASP